ncbi:MAG TPA: cation tolerance protein CutA [Fibrobacteres bacterium]|nr:cation tolerance protein CutA [Fibrobacterota bacterium]
MTDVSLIYITTRNSEDARRIGRIIVEQRLAACVNIIDRIGSIYWWEGRIAEESEALITAKTKSSLVNELVEKVKSIHEYSCPCIVALPINSGNEEFLDWVCSETR